MTFDLTEANGAEKGTTARHPVLAAARLLPLCLVLSLTLSGCMSSKGPAVSALMIDENTTGAITPLSADSEILSDSTVVRDLVAALGPKDMTDPQPWSNALTGSAGVISGLTASTEGGRACRLFQTTRHSYDGVGMFAGRACRRPDGGWDLVSFDRTGA